ncbi:MAG: TetR/AcrR family transcriptional regulator [Desulfobacteraceae bacterium]|jgi:AcrR family transcriptional regulator|nr:TetR/AcrR family transcriptional regulator [Desulfobacteraceae bacterium]
MANPESKKEQILKAAVDVIVDHGLESFSIRKLCNKSNLSIGLVYHHFSDKDKIIHSVLEHYGISLLSWVGENVSAAKGDTEKLKTKILDGYSIHKKLLSLIIILSNYFTRSFYSETERKSTASLMANYRKILIKIINNGITSGNFKVDNPEVLASLILGSTLGINLQASIDKTLDSDAAAALMADLILSHISVK